jgi:signal transduction histidine kinase
VSPAAASPSARLLLYFLLQAAIALGCMLAMRQPLPEPDARWAARDVVREDAGGRSAVTLPDMVDDASAVGAPPLYRMRFDAGPDGPEWAVLVPRFVNAVQIRVNGAVIGDSRREAATSRWDRNAPLLVVIPNALLRDGGNELTIRLFVRGPVNGVLDQVFIGPDRALRPAFEQREWMFVTVPIVLGAWQGILAAILGIMWLMRRHEPAYGVLALAMLVGVSQNFLPTTTGAGPSLLSTILITSAPLEAALVLMFAWLFIGGRLPRFGLAVLLPSAAVVVAALAGDPVLLGRVFVLVGVPSVGLYLVLMAIAVAQAVVRERNTAALLLGCSVTVMLTFWVHDILLVTEHGSFRDVVVGRLSYSVMLVAIGAGLTWRFARALNEVDDFAHSLVAQVRAAEDRLKASFAREEERARAVALAEERTRLMRDLHDGLGGQLVSIVAMSERGGETARMGDAARAALKDLRLVIDAMDDIGGDLMLALGAWRERLAAQLRPHDIALDWQVTGGGLPVHPELRPWHVIQVVRILDEAATNAVRHAAARRLTVTIAAERDAGAPRGRITIADDGRGFDRDGATAGPAVGTAVLGGTGRGLRNMESRAARCGATLTLRSGASGTTVSLLLPVRFPGADSGAAGLSARPPG